VSCYPPLDRLDISKLVDGQRAPFPDGASRLSTANSNTSLSPPTRPYPLHKKHFASAPPPPYQKSMYEFSNAKEYIASPEREIREFKYGYHDLQTPPYIHGFPRADNRADRRCRYLAHVPYTLPCQARHDYMLTSAHRVEMVVGSDGHACPPGPPPLQQWRAPLFCCM
jgi:hypothetical protein